MWGSLLWEIRGRIGQESADMIVVQAWQNIGDPYLGKVNAIVRGFAGALVKAAESISPDAQKIVSTLLKERGFVS